MARFYIFWTYFTLGVKELMGYILIVDDEPPIRSLLEEVLQEFGYTTKSVADGWECLRVAKSKNKPVMILLDHQMPGITGLDVLSLLKQNRATADIPIIMISSSNEIKGEAESQGACVVLEKPFDINMLIEHIKTILSDSYCRNEMR